MNRNLKEFVNHHASPNDVLQIDEFQPDHIVILLALYNGAGTLGEQLDSISRQTHKNWSLIISDDGSNDAWRPIFERFAAQHDTRCVKGPQKGSTQNFLNLISSAGPLVPYAALSDQDDVWLPPKLSRAMFVLKDVSPQTPALFVSPTVICDRQLKPLRRSKRFRQPPGFANALVQSIGGGNTMVLNRAALDLVQETARYTDGLQAHDWWIYQIVSGAGGVIKYDQMPLVLYRQHDTNQIGANDTLLGSAFRVKQLMQGRFQVWIADNLNALEKANHWLTPQSRQLLSDFKRMRSGALSTRVAVMRKIGLYRQTLRGQVALWIAVIFAKL